MIWDAKMKKFVSDNIVLKLVALWSDRSAASVTVPLVEQDPHLQVIF
jgi:hypothetical protein